MYTLKWNETVCPKSLIFYVSKIVFTMFPDFGWFDICSKNNLLYILIKYNYTNKLKKNGIYTLKWKETVCPNPLIFYVSNRVFT